MEITQSDLAMHGIGGKAVDGEGLLVTFFHRATENSRKTKEAGRPIYDDVEFIEIIVPGSRDVLQTAVKPTHLARFPEQYERFKKNEEQVVSGTPLSSWPMMTPARIAEMHALKIKTVEHLVSLPDNYLSKLGPDAVSLREAAREYVKRAKGNDSRVEALEAQLAELRKQLESAAGPKKRGRPKKVEVEAVESIDNIADEAIEGKAE